MQLVTEIYFVRHAKTTFIPSEYERALSNEGFEAIRKLEKLFEDILLDKAYSSPYKRARQTINSVVHKKVLNVFCRIIFEKEIQAMITLKILRRSA